MSQIFSHQTNWHVYNVWVKKTETIHSSVISHSSKSIWVIKLSFCQNDSPMGESFWQKDSLITHILFELWPVDCLCFFDSDVIYYGGPRLANQHFPHILIVFVTFVEELWCWLWINLKCLLTHTRKTGTKTVKYDIATICMCVLLRGKKLVSFCTL